MSLQIFAQQYLTRIMQAVFSTTFRLWGCHLSQSCIVCEFSHSVVLPNHMEILEPVRYSAALAGSGARRGTSWEKVYAELFWESLSFRRWSRRLSLFHKFINDLNPGYAKDPIPPLQESQCSFHNHDVVGGIVTRTEKYRCSFLSKLLKWMEQTGSQD